MTTASQKVHPLFERTNASHRWTQKLDELLPDGGRAVSCRVKGCPRTDKRSRGMCSTHYQRWRKYGSTAPPGRKQQRRPGTKAPDVSKWSRENLAWAAGLIEGEGSIMTRDKRHQVLLTVAMTDIEPLQALRFLFGGRIYGPHKKRNPRHTPTAYWRLTTARDAYAAIVAIYRWMSPRRRQQIERALKHFAITAPRGEVYPGKKSRRNEVGRRLCLREPCEAVVTGRAKLCPSCRAEGVGVAADYQPPQPRHLAGAHSPASREV